MLLCFFVFDVLEFFVLEYFAFYFNPTLLLCYGLLFHNLQQNKQTTIKIDLQMNDYGIIHIEYQ